MIIRPIQTADFAYFEIPTFASTAHGWVLEDAYLIGYAAIDPVPGLPHICDLYGFIDPAFRRRGYGSQFLKFVISQANAIGGVRQLSVSIDSTIEDSIPFLKKRDFYYEHLEYEMSRSVKGDIRPTGFDLKCLPSYQAAQQMIRLYDVCFQTLAWYQPYCDEMEVLDNLGNDGQIYFLESMGQLVGFAGVLYENGKAEIEPLGVVPAVRGEGFGRILINTLLYIFSQRGCNFAHLTVWADNTPALRLYESVGFVRQDKRQFMALDL